MKKQDLRELLIKKREEMSQQESIALSKKIIQNLLTLSEIRDAESFFIYISVRNEVNTKKLVKYLLEREKIVTVPRIISWNNNLENRAGIMKPYRITDFSQLELKNGFYEPQTKEYPRDLPLDIAIMPCLALTKKGHRLGMGGGFYDKFIENYPHMKLIALAYNWQILPHLPTKNHDKLVDIIVTEKEIFKRE